MIALFKLDRAVFAIVLIHCTFAAGGHSQEAAPESAAQQRDKRRLTPLILPPTALTNRDIGNLRWVQASEPPPTISVSTWQSLFYTDNVYRRSDDRRESLGWNGDVALKIVPYSTARWTPWIAADYFRFRYDREPAQDFDGQALTFGSRLSVSEDDAWLWDISYSLWRFVDGHDRSHEFFKQGRLENNFSWTQPLLSQPALYYAVSYGVAFRHASPGSFDRIENEVALSLHYYPIRALELNGFVHAALRQYLADEGTQGHRNDLHLESGLSVVWDWHRNLSIRGEISWIWNDSNRSSEDYHVLEPQLTLFAELDF